MTIQEAGGLAPFKRQGHQDALSSDLARVMGGRSLLRSLSASKADMLILTFYFTLYQTVVFPFPEHRVCVNIAYTFVYRQMKVGI